MNAYIELLTLVRSNQPCTRDHLELLKSGKFKNQVAECIDTHQYIELKGKNSVGVDLFGISVKGQYVLDHPKEETK